MREIHRSPVNSPHKGQWGFDVFFDLRLSKRLSKQSRRWWFEMPSAHYDVTLLYVILNDIDVYTYNNNRLQLLSSE